MRLPRPHLRSTICDLRFTNRNLLRGLPLAPRLAPRASRSGVALVITIVLLSVILFLTVAFLALMGREKGAVKTSIDQTTARLGAESAVEHAKSAMIATILHTSNTASFDLLISTNFINWYGFDPGVTLANGNPLTNVNHAFLFNGNPLDQDQALQNLTNLLYSPRVPVYITNRLAANSVDFRYYLDLNRNRRHDRTGLWPATNDLGGYFTTNGLVTATFSPPNVLSNYFIGDPEWIGVLDRPDKPHGPDNRFLSRIAYIVVPEGKTLDVNYIHNNAKTDALLQNGFFRNQGIAPWEINLAAFFYDLNTNVWTYNLYSTNTYPGTASTGTAFDDAYAFWRWRQGTLGQASVQTLFGGAGVGAITTDYFDSYTAGPLLASPFGFTADSDFANGTALNPWPGADTENHYFSTQDFFDPIKTRIGGVAGDQFPERLTYLGASNSTYNSSTYYRMLAQLGTASTPESSDKLNLNYVNVGGLAATNFILWTDTNAIQVALGAGVNPPLLFFTNVANSLLMKYSQEWLASDYSVYTNVFRMDRTFGVTNIPVVISNQWVFSPAVHRALQLAANIWETKQGTNVFPTVFRPRFDVDAAGTNVYIVDFVPVETRNDVAAQTLSRPILDLMSTNNPALAIPTDGDVMIYGVPLVVGARKGLPNFNEFASELLVSVTRKLQVRKAGRTITQTNQVFTMEVQMPTGVEFWNSYATNFNRPVSIYVTNVTSMTMTNDLALPGDFTTTVVTGDRILATNNWRAYRAFNARDPKSFVTLMRTNVPFLPQRLYVPASTSVAPGFYATNQNVWDDSQQFIMPRWGITISNRVHAMIVDAATQQIIDYVVLGNMTYVTNLTDIIGSSASLTTAQFGDAGATPPAFKQLWATNQPTGAPPGGLLSGRLGVIQQINISVGAVARQGQWESYGKFTPNAPDAAVALFNNFMYTLVTNGTATVPYTPSFQFRVPLSWQANDPLVHYLAGDLYDTEASGIVALIDPARQTFSAELKGLAAKNSRYQPWPIDGTTVPDAYAIDLKDPLVRASDDWQFPTNVMPSIGGLGRVHRGTPWQTVYLKASDLGWTNPAAGMVGWLGNLTDAGPAVRWRRHTGNRVLQEGYYYRPVTDRVLFDVFTSALNDNSTRGRLNVNQTNLAAWSAIFTGVAALTNTSELAPIYNPWIIEPAGAYDSFDATTWTPVARLVNGINTLRANPYYFPAGTFQKLGDILAVPELSDASPFLNRASVNARQRALNDAAYEWLPQQIMGLLHLDETPRFSIFAYGQSLSPAPESIVTTGGPLFGLCTNYAITAEVALRAVVRVEGSPNPAHTNAFLPLNKQYPPRVVVESYNYLPPE